MKNDLQNGTNTDPEYFIYQDMIFRGDLILIPKALQPVMLRELHHTHVGIVKMKRLARMYCTWENINEDIEQLVKSCEPCALLQRNPTKVPIHP